MSTMNISLPDSLKSFVDGQVSDGDYTSSSEYVRELNDDRFHILAKQALEKAGILVG